MIYVLSCYCSCIGCLSLSRLSIINLVDRLLNAWCCSIAHVLYCSVYLYDVWCLRNDDPSKRCRTLQTKTSTVLDLTLWFERAICIYQTKQWNHCWNVAPYGHREYVMRHVFAPNSWEPTHWDVSACAHEDWYGINTLYYIVSYYVI